MITEKELTESVAVVEKNNEYDAITDQSQLDKAGLYLKQVKAKYKELEATRLGMTRPLDDSKAKIMNMFRPVLDRLKTIEDSVKKQIMTYTIKEEARVRAVQAEAARIADEIARAIQEEAEKDKEANAQLLRDCGLSEDAEEVAVAEIIATPTIAPVMHIVKPAGITTREVWKFRITDEKLVPREYLTIDMVKVGNIAKTLKADAKIPGVEVYSEKTMY